METVINLYDITLPAILTVLMHVFVFRIEKIAEVIADLRQPTSTNITLQANEQTFVESQDSQLGGGGSNLSFIELRNDSDTLLRCLALTGELLKELHARKLNPTLRTLVDALVSFIVCIMILTYNYTHTHTHTHDAICVPFQLLPCIQNENPYVRDMALFCLGLACLLDINIARNNILLFLQVGYYCRCVNVTFVIVLYYANSLLGESGGPRVGASNSSESGV